MTRIASRLLAVSSALLLLGSFAIARTRPRYAGTAHVEVRRAGERDAIARHLAGETLTVFGPQGQTLLNLATRWESQNGDRRWQFWLRTNVHFHDGSALTPGIAAELLSQSHPQDCPSVRASIDSIVIECDKPVSNLPAVVADSAYALLKPGTIGTGAWKLSDPTVLVAPLVAFDDHWRGRPFLNSVEVASGRSLRDQWMDISIGRADLVEVPAESLRRTQQDRLRILQGRNNELVALRFAQSVDPRARRAVAAVVDRSALLNVIFQRQGEIASGILPQWLSGYAHLFPSVPNLQRARELRLQLQHSAPMRIGSDDPTLQLAAERIALNAREAGIALQSVAGTANADIAIVRVALPSTEPDAALDGILRSLAVPAEGASSEIKDVFRREQELISSGAIVPLVYIPRAYGYSERLRNLRLDATGTPDFSETWMEERP